MRQPLDRMALERVIGRAAELAAIAGEAPESGVSDEQIVELGRELGIPVPYLRQALAEEHTRTTVPEDQTGIARYLGPTHLSAARTVRGTPEQALAALDRWMDREECLRIKRRFGERVTWEPRRDLVGNIKRGFNLGGRGYALSKATEVGATAVPVDQGRTLVRLDANLEDSRRSSTVGGVTGMVGGVGGGAGLLAIAALTGGSVLVAGVVAAGVGAIGLAAAGAVARSQRKLTHRVQLALEQVLDRLEHGDMGQSSVIAALNAASRSLR
jgi:hypothetical protein